MRTWAVWRVMGRALPWRPEETAVPNLIKDELSSRDAACRIANCRGRGGAEEGFGPDRGLSPQGVAPQQAIPPQSSAVPQQHELADEGFSNGAALTGRPSRSG